MDQNWLLSILRGGNQHFNFFDMLVRQTAPLILPLDYIKKALKILKLNYRKLCPFVFRLQSRLKLPFARMARRGDQASLALFSFLTPFVFLHDLGKGQLLL